MFKNVEFIRAFYDDCTEEVFYCFKTLPQIDHGDWAISAGGDVAYDLCCENITQQDFPSGLINLLEYIPENVEIEGLKGEV